MGNRKSMKMMNVYYVIQIVGVFNKMMGKKKRVEKLTNLIESFHKFMKAQDTANKLVEEELKVLRQDIDNLTEKLIRR
jgi:accessory colonization factor AcfC